MTTTDQQLSFEVEPHPSTQRGDGSFVPLHGGLKFTVEISIDHDLQPGHQIVASIADADGQVLGSALGKVETVSFVPIKDKGVTIAQVREHKVKGI